MAIFTTVIDDPNAPRRLRGKTVTLDIDETKQTMSFAVDMPEDASDNEIAYFKFSVGEIADRLREKFSFIGYGQKCTFKGEGK